MVWEVKIEKGEERVVELGTNQGSRGDWTVYYAGTKSFKTRSFIYMLKYLGYFY